MPYCPNPDCSFRKRFGESAEYGEGTIMCSDCEATLVADDLLGKVVKEKEKLRMRDIYKRILWTLLLLGFYNALSHVSLPGIDYDAMARMPFRVSLFALGLMPYITAYVLVEIAALFVQPFKRWRQQDGDSGRYRLLQTAKYLTLVIAILHGSALIRQLGKMMGGRVFVYNTMAFKSLLVLTCGSQYLR